VPKVYEICQNICDSLKVKTNCNAPSVLARLAAEEFLLSTCKGNTDR